MVRGARATGVRKLERVVPDLANDLRRTVAAHDRDSCLRALAATAELYVRLRAQLSGSSTGGAALLIRVDAERVALAYLSELLEAPTSGAAGRVQHDV